MAWPSTLVRTKDWTTEILTDSDLEGQFDLIITYINDMMNNSTGHKHDGTSSEGPIVQLSGGNIGVGGGPLSVSLGGTGLATVTDGAIMLGSGTGAVTPLAVTTDGEIVIGDGTTDPTTLAAFTGAAGTLQHEYGGVEADISAVEKGGIVAGTGSGSMDLLAVGTDDQVLIADASEASGLNWVDSGAASAFIAYHSATQDISEGSFGQISFNSEDLDAGGNFASNAYTAPVTGTYLFTFSCSVTTDQNATAGIEFAIFVGGAEKTIIAGGSIATTAQTIGIGGSALVQLTASDVVTLYGNSTSAAGLRTIAAGRDDIQFSGFRII